jgi:hypothetical protein
MSMAFVGMCWSFFNNREGQENKAKVINDKKSGKRRIGWEDFSMKPKHYIYQSSRNPQVGFEIPLIN